MPLILSGDTGVPASGMPTGSVIQTVNGLTSTQVSNSTSTFADTTLTATITPTSAANKILVLVNQCGVTKAPVNNNSATQLQLLRGATVISKIQGYAGWTGANGYNYIGSVSSSFLDSPATTSAITYKTQFKNEQNAASVDVNSDGSTSTITLLEIKA
jgi:hypothetical protein